MIPALLARRVPAPARTAAAGAVRALSTPSAFMTEEQLAGAVERGEIDTVVVAFPDMYGRLMGKRYDAAFYLSSGTHNAGTHACNYLLGCNMDMDPIPGFKLFNFDKGYGDFHLVPDHSTLRRTAWAPGSVMVLCDVQANDATHAPISVAPRTLLKSQVARADAMGFKALAATELEYFMFETSYREAFRQKYDDLERFSDYVEDYHILQGAREEVFNRPARQMLKDSGITVENSKGEAAIGQHELNVCYNDAVAMADDHMVYKQCMKELAEEQRMSVSFMAKPFSDEAGSSCHVHLSLWDAAGENNMFVGPHSPLGCSDQFLQFLAGWIKYTPEVCVFMAPTINSYKRFKEGSWAPTRLAWSFDNRTAGFRVVGSGKSLRIECRIPGADVNPYLLLSASIAAGLRGIEEKLAPPPMFEGDMYQASKLPRVPRSLDHAISLFDSSAFARETFGDEVVDHYVNFYAAEQAAFEGTVTEWERIRYFERI